MRAARVGAAGVSGEIVKQPTQAQRPPEVIAESLVAMLRGLGAAGAAVGGIGLGVPTTVDDEGGLDPSPNLPTMTGFPIARFVAEKLGKPVAADNDARCFALGEWRYGAGRGTRNMVGITLGTGIGCGIIAEGRVVRGARRQAGEIWRAPATIDPGQEVRANVEQCVSGTALEALCPEKSGADVAALARSGDRAAQRAFESLGMALGRVMLWLADLLDPEVFVLGGSVVEFLVLFEPAMRRALGERKLRVVRSELGLAAGVLGAASLVQIQEEMK